jgi:GTP1/Obg family GTP-binding protein
MNQLTFDENLAIREVLDDIIGMVDRREKLIRSAAEEAERSRNDRMAHHVTQLEALMSDFLTLFEPIMVKIRKYGEGLRDSIIDSENYLRSLVGIIDAGKNVEGTSATLQELQRDADGVQEQLELSSEMVGKIDDLLRKTMPYSRQALESRQQPSLESPNSPRDAPRRDQRVLKTHISGPYFLPGSRLLPDKPSKSQH